MQFVRQSDFLAHESGTLAFHIYGQLGGLLRRQIEKSDTRQNTDNDESQNRLNDTHTNLLLMMLNAFPMHPAGSFSDFKFAYAVRVKTAQIQIPRVLLRGCYRAGVRGVFVSGQSSR